MTEITVKQLMAPIGVIAFIIGTFTTIDTRYAKQADLDAIQARMERGDKKAELASKLYHATGAWVDLIGRNSLYQAKQEAGIITPDELIRWDSLKILVIDSKAELDKFAHDMDLLQ